MAKEKPFPPIVRKAKKKMRKTNAIMRRLEFSVCPVQTKAEKPENPEWKRVCVCASTLFVAYLLEHKLIRKNATGIWGKRHKERLHRGGRKQGQSDYCFVIHF